MWPIFRRCFHILLAIEWAIFCPLSFISSPLPSSFYFILVPISCTPQRCCSHQMQHFFFIISFCLHGDACHNKHLNNAFSIPIPVHMPSLTKPSTVQWSILHGWVLHCYVCPHSSAVERRRSLWNWKVQDTKLRHANNWHLLLFVFIVLVLHGNYLLFLMLSIAAIHKQLNTFSPHFCSH